MEGCAEHIPPADQGPDIRVMVCGPISYRALDRFAYAMDMAWRRRRITHVIHWGGHGVAPLAERWGTRRSIELVNLEPGRKMAENLEAENRRVLATGRPEAIIVFPGDSYRVGSLLEIVGTSLPVWHPYGT